MASPIRHPLIGPNQDPRPPPSPAKPTKSCTDTDLALCLNENEAPSTDAINAVAAQLPDELRESFMYSMTHSRCPKLRHFMVKSCASWGHTMDISIVSPQKYGHLSKVDAINRAQIKLIAGNLYVSSATKPPNCFPRLLVALLLGKSQNEIFKFLGVDKWSGLCHRVKTGTVRSAFLSPLGDDTVHAKVVYKTFIELFILPKASVPASMIQPQSELKPKPTIEHVTEKDIAAAVAKVLRSMSEQTLASGAFFPAPHQLRSACVILHRCFSNGVHIDLSHVTAILADEMGLGKTGTVIFLLLIIRALLESNQVLMLGAFFGNNHDVIRREVQKFGVNLRVMEFEGAGGSKDSRHRTQATIEREMTKGPGGAAMADIFVTSHASLRPTSKWLKKTFGKNYHFVTCFDEIGHTDSGEVWSFLRTVELPRFGPAAPLPTRDDGFPALLNILMSGTVIKFDDGEKNLLSVVASKERMLDIHAAAGKDKSLLKQISFAEIQKHVLRHTVEQAAALPGADAAVGTPEARSIVVLAPAAEQTRRLFEAAGKVDGVPAQRLDELSEYMQLKTSKLTQPRVSSWRLSYGLSDTFILSIAACSQRKHVSSQLIQDFKLTKRDPVMRQVGESKLDFLFRLNPSKPFQNMVLSALEDTIKAAMVQLESFSPSLQQKAEFLQPLRTALLTKSVVDVEKAIAEVVKYDSWLRSELRNIEYDSASHSANSVRFTERRPTLKIMQIVFEMLSLKFCGFSGESTPMERADAMRRFCTDPTVRVIFVTTGAGATGADMTNAVRTRSDCIKQINDWLQAEKRVARPGQTRETDHFYEIVLDPHQLKRVAHGMGTYLVSTAINFTPVKIRPIREMKFEGAHFKMTSHSCVSEDPMESLAEALLRVGAVTTLEEGKPSGSPITFEDAPWTQPLLDLANHLRLQHPVKQHVLSLSVLPAAGPSVANRYEHDIGPVGDASLPQQPVPDPVDGSEESSIDSQHDEADIQLDAKNGEAAVRREGLDAGESAYVCTLFQQDRTAQKLLRVLSNAGVHLLDIASKAGVQYGDPATYELGVAETANFLEDE
eukprot:TRINITY_DN3749_c0_g2_i1.p1 TRINITY_DN3749_c0_g2~~TRINITY_DN3749_c0_g2_i1.p1  ORF type:complete len:1062 (+),score=153.79 TRINITY_DN3749_c0_g2_i1:700-3885(+)